MSYQYRGRGFLQTTGRNMPNSLSSVSLQPISVNGSAWNTSNITASASFDFNSLLSNQHLKKYEMYESTEDVVALGCAAHRMMRDLKIHYKVTDRELYSKVEQQDRDKSKEIKDYYSKKIMMLKLKNSNPLSPFREDMNKLIHSDGLVFKENMIGIAYWLPYFHSYDLDLDYVKSSVTPTHDFEKLNNNRVPGTMNLSANLTPLKSMKRATKRGKHQQYWLRDDKLNAAVNINIEDKNQLQHLWDYLFENESTLKIKGNYSRTSRDGFEYFSVTKWELDRS
jgi:hypothetical protein